MSISTLDDIVQQVLGGREVSLEEHDWLRDKIGFHLEDAAHEHKKWQAAPKISDELERLDQIIALSRKLHRKLASLDAITRGELAGQLEDLEKPQRLQGPVPVPVPAASIAREMVAQSWNEGVPPLEALARAAQGSRDFLARRAGSLSGAGVRRGVGNLHSHAHGNLRDQVTYQLALWLGRYQGLDAVRTTQGGKLHRLAVAAWEEVVGTGSGTADGEMEAVVKRVAPIARRMLEAEQQREHDVDLKGRDVTLFAVETNARWALRQPRPRRRRLARLKGGISPEKGEMPP